MKIEEVEEILEELHQVRPELLNDKSRRLFEAIMCITDQRDELIKENKHLNDLLDGALEEYEELLIENEKLKNE